MKTIATILYPRQHEDLFAATILDFIWSAQESAGVDSVIVKHTTEGTVFGINTWQANYKAVAVVAHLPEGHELNRAAPYVKHLTLQRFMEKEHGYDPENYPKWDAEKDEEISKSIEDYQRQKKTGESYITLTQDDGETPEELAKRIQEVWWKSNKKVVGLDGSVSGEVRLITDEV